MSVIKQEILSGPQYPPTLTVQRVSAKDAAGQFAKCLSEPGTKDIVPVGVAYHISSKGVVEFMCLAQPNAADVLLISLRNAKFDQIARILSAGARIQACLVGFGMAQIAISISHATNLPVKGVDLLTLFPKASSPYELVKKTVGTRVSNFAVQRLWMGNKASAETDIALRAWLAACAGNQCKPEVVKAVRLDTANLEASELVCLSQLVAQSDLLEKIKPRMVQNDFAKGGLDKQGKVQLQCTRFKTRVRRSNQTRVILTDSNNNRFHGTATKAKGKTTTIELRNGKGPTGDLRTVKVVGLPEPTNAEKARDGLIYLLLTGQKKLGESQFIQKLWFPHGLGKPSSKSDPPQETISLTGLNDSQCNAVRAMVTCSPIVIVHGPPGTGKTTTITAAAQIWDSRKHSVWIVAHSNVAVKNIAQKLFDKKVNFKILVSKEFHEEWHEHLYQSIDEKLIRSDDLPDNKVAMERLILDSKVILSTLSMMLNPQLHDNGTFTIVPPQCLVIDEASQVNAFEFMPIFDSFRKNLQKICFFGDPMQLPPFGQDDVPEMKTIFDFKHLNRKEDTYFLNIQYRMPNPIARFISDNVYDRRLLSKHEIDNPSCVAFIDVPRTGEAKAGTSTKNVGEVETVVHLVKYYYRKLGFCVITPYDAQRAAIQKELEAENLPYDTVYNVDSFQGNEADYVIVSLVRSDKPGFLSSLKRMNVLLTRCRRGLIIVSSQAFLGPEGKGSHTLLGKLVHHWQTRHSQTWIDWRSVADGSVNLPGVTRSLATPSESRPPRNAATPKKPAPIGGPSRSTVNTAQGRKGVQKSITSNPTPQKQAPKAKSRNAAKSQGSSIVRG